MGGERQKSRIQKEELRDMKRGDVDCVIISKRRMSERPQREEMRRKKRAKEVSGSASAPTHGSPQHLCLRKKQRE